MSSSNSCRTQVVIREMSRKTLKEIYHELDRDIYVGEHYERNMRGITYGAILIAVANVITGALNLMNGYDSAVVASFAFVIGGLVILFFTRIRPNRTYAIAAAAATVVVIFTYETITVPHGFPIFWTLILPLAFCYLANVKTGILLSLYFLALYCVLFCTPLHSMFTPQYSDVMIQRFPILYLADVILTTYIMVQYHLTTLRQMDDAAKLLEAKEEADRANAAKSDFLAEMSHEIRTPINAVLGMNEMVLRESHKAKKSAKYDSNAIGEALDNIESYAGNVHRAGKNLLAIVNDILDFSKIESGQTELIEGRYRLSSVVNDLSNMALLRAREKGLQFSLDVDESIPDALYGDEVRIRQILTNILSNAMKYTHQGSVSMSIRRTGSDVLEKGQTINLVITVRDTGIGIKPEDVKKLFTKFQRVDLGTNSTVEGTGLGLAIVKNLTDMMGGDIDVKSVYGKGSAFVITLPQVVVAVEPIGNIEARFAEYTQGSIEYGVAFRAPEAHILIVDDTPMNITVAVGLLKGAEMQIDTATSGIEALELTRIYAYDLVLLDQRMPVMDGTAVLHEIRLQDGGKNKETPIICLTADAIIGARDRYIAEGFTDYLTKPIDGQTLTQMLMEYLPEDLVLPAFVEPMESLLGGERLEAGHEADAHAPLIAAGIDTAIGLRYCQDDELYRSMLEEFARNAEEKTREMRLCRDTRDWENLSILAHSIKSTSKTIGAMALSDIAASVERAADERSLGDLDSTLPQMIAKYEEVVSAIMLLIPPSDELPYEGDEIMEFLPR